MKSFTLKSFFNQLHEKSVNNLVLAFVLFAICGGYLYIAQKIASHSLFSVYVDDAFIHLRFVHNFASGYGFVWNRGAAPVEGFTSFLYVLFLILLEKLGIAPISTLPYIGALSTILTLVISLRLFEWINPDYPFENKVAVIMLGLSPHLLHWSFSGLETTLYTFLLTASALAYLSYRFRHSPSWLVGSIFGVCALTRPESIALFGITILFDLILDLANLRKRLTNVLIMIFSFGIVFIPVFLWKWSYFGYPFPNTYYAKTGAGLIQIQGGLLYLIKSLLNISLRSLVPAIFIVLTFQWKLYRGYQARLYILTIIVASCLIIVTNGGDHFPGARFLISMLPFLFALASIGMTFLSNYFRKINSVTLYAPLLILTTTIWFPSAEAIFNHPTDLRPASSTNLQYFDDWISGYILMGKALHQKASPEDTIALVPIGAIGYYSEMKVVDMVGLTDPVIAHEPFDHEYINPIETWRPGHDKGDGIYVLSKKPTYIQLIDRLTSRPLSGIDEQSLQYKSIVEIWNSAELHDRYEFYPIQIQGGWYYNLYRRKDYAGD